MSELPLVQRSLPELDARVIPHRLRHAAVLGAVASLHPGEAMVLVAPHDPKPLLAQIAEAHGDQIEVSYRLHGDDETGAWKLELARV